MAGLQVTKKDIGQRLRLGTRWRTGAYSAASAFSDSSAPYKTRWQVFTSGVF
jgi:hypothetical protein